MPGFFLIENAAYPAALTGTKNPDPSAVIAADDGHVWIHLDGETFELIWQDAVTHYAEAAGGTAGDDARAPMPGTVIAVMVAENDAVKEGAPMLDIESMKLEMAINAPRDGVVAAIHRTVGQAFERDALLVSLKVES